MTDAIQAAIAYRERTPALYTVPTPKGTKGSKQTGWQNERLSVEAIPQRFQADSNLLVILGVDNLVDVDLDSQEAIRAWPFFGPTPDTKFRWGRASKPNSHGLYFVNKPMRSESYTNPVKPEDGKQQTIAEFRCLKKDDGGIGKGTIIPPGIHQSGEVIRFESGADASATIAAVDADALFTAVRRTAAAALLAKYWPADGSGGHRFEIALAGALAQGGLEQDFAEAFVLAAYQARAKCDISRLSVVRYGVRDTYAKRAKEAAHTGFTRMCELAGAAAAPALVDALEWVGIVREDWEEPLPIEPTLRPVEPLDLDILPPLLAKYSADIANATSVAPEVPLITILTAASIAIGNRAVIQPKVLESGWQEVPNLWGAIVGEPGSGKSPAMKAALAPLYKIDKELRQQSDAAKTEYAKREKEYKRKLALYEKQKTRIETSDDPDAPLPEEPIAPQKPPYRQLIVHETTPEKLHEKCIDNPHGLLNHSDELHTWFVSMERKGHESERGMWLKAWSGNESHEIATIGRGTKYLPTLCLSVIGSTQPQKWRSYIRSVMGEGAGNDGLVQRLQLCIWPDDVPGTYTDIPRDARIAAQVEARLRAMVAIGGDEGTEPVVFKFTPDGQEVFINWWNRLEARRKSSEHTEAVLSHFAKYKGFMPSLALIFELFDDAPGLFDTSPAAAGFRLPEVISAKNATRAVRFLKWLSLHVARTYGCLDDTFRAGALCERVKAGELGASFTFIDVRRKGWKGLKTKEDVQDALDGVPDLVGS